MSRAIGMCLYGTGLSERHGGMQMKLRYEDRVERL